MADSERASRTGTDSKDYELSSKDLDFVVKALIDADSKILRYEDTFAVEQIKLKLKAIRSRNFWIEQDLMAACSVQAVRTPYNERIVFTNAFFIGELSILNTTRHKPCRQLVWYVRILRSDGAAFRTTWPCLLQITPRRFYEKNWGEPEDAFPGVCLLVVDKDKKIVTVEPNLEERI